MDQIPSLQPIAGGDRGKYRLVVDAIEELCAKLGPGARLPPHRTMAAELNVTISTLTRAVSDLTRRGLLITRRGSGTTIAKRIPPHKEPVAEGLVDFRFNVPPIEPVAHILREVLAAVQGNADVFQAEPLGGSATARQAGVEWLRLRGLNPASDHVFLTDGTHQGLIAALRMVTQPGDKVLCEALHYSGVRQIADLLGLHLLAVPIDHRGLDVEAFHRLAREFSPRAAVLTPETQMPTSTTLAGPVRHEIVATARETGMFLIEDDIFGHLASDGEPTLTSLAPERSILVTSMSKCISAGVRIGHILVPAKLTTAAEKALGELGWTSSALYSALSQKLIFDGLAQKAVAAQREEALARARVARSILGSAIVIGDDGPKGPKPSYHGWLTLPPGRALDRFVTELADRRVLVSSAYSFAQSDPVTLAAVRIGLGNVSGDRLEAGLQRVASVLNGGGSNPLGFV
ncbi:MAG: PLP-dependent aminotransferase family protein [Mesorhizobium sp.]|nr:MAG: PLP-dependent aminotransferase family protein [Mesorhizobium sp.]